MPSWSVWRKCLDIRAILRKCLDIRAIFLSLSQARQSTKVAYAHSRGIKCLVVKDWASRAYSTCCCFPSPFKEKWTMGGWVKTNKNTLRDGWEWTTWVDIRRNEPMYKEHMTDHDITTNSSKISVENHNGVYIQSQLWACFGSIIWSKRMWAGRIQWRL